MFEVLVLFLMLLLFVVSAELVTFMISAAIGISEI